MYFAHFGLREAPFSITPDTHFVFSGKAHQEALNTLLLALGSGEGIVKVTGEVGTGKTLLCRRFLAAMGDKSAGDKFVTAYLHNPAIEPRTLLLELAEELSVVPEKGSDQYHLLKRLNLALLGFARQGKAAVLCLDEAQAVPLDTLEMLRLLSNLETEKRKLLRLVLFGQPELDVKLADPSVRQIKQRISFHYRLGGLGRDEIDGYLTHRLRIAGQAHVRRHAGHTAAGEYRCPQGPPGRLRRGFARGDEPPGALCRARHRRAAPALLAPVVRDRRQ